MLKKPTIFINSYIIKRCCSFKPAPKNLKAYQHSIFLPKSDFPKSLNPEEVVERDKKIHEEAKFLEFYNWQRKNLNGEFVLHDGPPYANGQPHIGHAINKILKDIILRSQTIQGTRVHFVPGWDCHGLPIELEALKNTTNPLTPQEIRQKARDVALKMSDIQKKAFIDWGVMGDWTNQCYYTCAPDYVVNQLLVFWKFYEKGLIFHDLKPVYWSPSSKTALAEAELVYQPRTSTAVYVRLNVVQHSQPEPLYLLVWTTTPWTLPLNKAVYCSSKIRYSKVRIPSFPGLYIIATDLIEELQNKLKVEITKESDISWEEITSFKYNHPWNKNEVLDVFESSSLKMLGTGLLHSTPGHGFEDYILSLEHKLKVECFVDENGRYTRNAGKELSGKYVMFEGKHFVVEKLASDFIFTEKLVHNYPFDWRTNKPVLIRPSHQWFIDSNQLKDKAIKCLKEVKVPLKFFETKLKSRPYWCLSRQRKWGVPIPAFFHKTSGRPLLSKSLVHHICSLIETSGTDVWWEESLETLFPDKFCNEFFVKREDVVKGEDIMDIWFDSGISWSYVLKGKKSEIYLEGEDQYSGWFQSSLLTSAAIQNEAPFKKIMTHGFAVDKNERKMSKSLGNVLDPETVIKGKNALGVDTLRWWVAKHSHLQSVMVSREILESSATTVNKIRGIFKFLLGALRDTPAEKSNPELTSFDRYTLNACYILYHSVMDYYNVQNLHKVAQSIDNFVSNDVSSDYVYKIKDRLYCDELNSSRRKACLYTLNGILDTLSYTVAPILPHLVEEVYKYHPIHRGQRMFFFNKNVWTPPEFWKDDSFDEIFQVLDDLNLKKKTLDTSCVITAEGEIFEKLKTMQNGQETSTDSELTEFFSAAEVRLKTGKKGIIFTKVNASQCLRCRRYTAPETADLCNRCHAIVS